MTVLMNVGSRVRHFRVRHGSGQLVYPHRVGVVTTTAAWVGIKAAFWEPSIDTIPS